MAGRVAYYGNIVKDGLVLCLDAAKKDSYPGSGTLWSDVSGNANNGTLINGPTFDNNNGGSILFDGTNDYVDVVDTPLRITNYNFTVEFVFYYNNTTYTAKPILGKRNPNTPFNQWCFFIGSGNPYLGGSGKVLFCFLRDDNNPNNSIYDRTLTYTLPSAGIYHVILTNSQSSTELWVNGVQRSTSSIAYTSGNFNMSGYNFRLADGYLSSYYNEKIYLCRIYKKSLTSSELLQNYNATKGRYI